MTEKNPEEDRKGSPLRAFLSWKGIMVLVASIIGGVIFWKFKQLKNAFKMLAYGKKIENVQRKNQ